MGIMETSKKIKRGGQDLKWQKTLKKKYISS